MRLQQFSPSEIRLIRAARIGGWLLAALAVAAMLGVLVTVKHRLSSQAAQEGANWRSFVASVRACRWAQKPPRSWDDCEAIVHQRNFENSRR